MKRFKNLSIVASLLLGATTSFALNEGLNVVKVKESQDLTTAEFVSELNSIYKVVDGGFKLFDPSFPEASDFTTVEANGLYIFDSKSVVEVDVENKLVTTTPECALELTSGLNIVALGEGNLTAKTTINGVSYNSIYRVENGAFQVFDPSFPEASDFSTTENGRYYLVELAEGITSTNTCTTVIPTGDGVLPSSEVITTGVSIPVDMDRDGIFDDLEDPRCLNTDGGVVNRYGCSENQIATKFDDDKDGVFGDANGVVHGADICPSTPEGATVNAEGCALSQLDLDNDGVTDDLDLCPTTGDATDLNENGCAIYEIDTDSDGIVDSEDTCSNTIAGITVNSSGCADYQTVMPDTDKDGIGNDIDLCPNEVGTIKDLGCPAGHPELDDDNDGIKNALDLCPETMLQGKSQPVSYKVETQEVCKEVAIESEVSSESKTVYNAVLLEVDTNGIPSIPVAKNSSIELSEDSSSAIITFTEDILLAQYGDSPSSTTNMITNDGGMTVELPITVGAINFLKIIGVGGTSVIFSIDVTEESVTVENGSSNTETVCETVEVKVPVYTNNSSSVDGNGCALYQIDEDGDGVKDELDECSATPAGKVVDYTGCEPEAPPALPDDEDNDGIADEKDSCLGTNVNNGLPIDEAGCSLDQIDSDSDTVMDNVDVCPNTDEGLTVVLEGATIGCADNQLDDDNDGVNNDLDDCPTTKMGAEVDENGCILGKEDGIIPILGDDIPFSMSDVDNDGIIDLMDKCPNDATNTCISTAVPVDTDGDGFVDSLDSCPNEAGIAPNGCPTDDKDGDGVKDSEDNCPDIAGYATQEEADQANVDLGCTDSEATLEEPINSSASTEISEDSAATPAPAGFFG